ncbi:ogr/Delta-like zinc finger family protein [Aeromonas hydrophila]|uniref:ogr/Delta-like zinc finger family protein n=1 Tax=Aeromonas hydrophila TaxID=644 RepID=UPI0009BEFE31|nr:ogr/Delta-like zinc finger family protein [Aeromonas hydrophila]EJN6953793.1 ogr/Delta-like zinc finger family protein [Aeromonas hydrophila]MBW3795104.1 transcriptional regulator [Aeromonas hydrophila]MBW3800681.1 transcriptional regulator [Aeromonas hydrophila]MBW3817956.1 transcriptional regulator [Aeromonas hydrophila]TNI65545.1 transcriptional regulator [Aeromonas hydrophila]
MRVVCNQCQSLGRVTKSNHLSENVTDLYCECTMCSHAWVSTLAYKHTLRPSNDKASTVVIDLINALPPSARQSILDEIKKSNK